MKDIDDLKDTAASFKTPDGQLHYCQRKGCPTPCDKPGRRHLYNVARHPVTWRGTASGTTPFCGDPECPGADPAATTSSSAGRAA